MPGDHLHRRAGAGRIRIVRTDQHFQRRDPGLPQEVVDAIHADGGLAGIHVCANTDWSLVLESGADIVNFDAYAYFDRFILYGESQIRDFLAAGVSRLGHRAHIETRRDPSGRRSRACMPAGRRD
jgi:hypothetical protein